MRNNTAFAISLIAHAALLGALAILAQSGRETFRAAPGEAVSVWIEAPEGGQAKRRKNFGPDLQAHARGAVVAPSADRSPGSRLESSAADSSSGAGGGESTDASGAAKGRGAGGDALLAKIWRKIDSSKYYPSAARRRGIAGAPRVTFAISRNGEVEWVRLESSSGQAMLDEAAIATVRRAAPLPYYPAPITLAVKYSMDE